MKANLNSWHAWLYEMTYTSSLPTNLCPYFWKLIFSIIIFIPNFIIQIPSYLINLILKEDLDCCQRRLITFGICFCLIILIGYFLLLIEWIKAMFNCHSYDYVAANLGWIIHVIALYLILGHLYTKRKQKAGASVNRENIWKEYAKAQYYKYCPKIEWYKNN